MTKIRQAQAVHGRNVSRLLRLGGLLKLIKSGHPSPLFGFLSQADVAFVVHKLLGERPARREVKR